MRKKKWAGMALVLAFGLAVPAQASAGPYLGKQEARRYTVKAVKELWHDVDWADDYWVEGYRACERFSRTIVECDFQISNATWACDDTVRIVVKNPDTYFTRFPYDADCYDAE